ncbi:MAG: cysteine hydrolase [Alphaproteobacteria bacterium]|jgi:ureidoacrylate peracid hydrolase
MSSGIPDDLRRVLSGRRDDLAVFDSIDVSKTALLAIDMQRAWTDPAGPWYFPQARTVIDPINRMAAAVRHQGLVVWVQHVTGPPGTPEYWATYLDNFVSDAQREGALAAIQMGSQFRNLEPDLDVHEADLRIEKRRYSAMIRTSSNLEWVLRERGIDTVIVTGVQTNMCVESTARDAMMLDFKVFMPHDAAAARTEDDHLAGLRTVAQVFADIRPVEELLALMAAQGGPKTP